MSTARLLWIVWNKELRDGARDRRSIFSLLIGAMIAPILLGVMFTIMAGRRNADEIKVPVAGVEYAPAFIDWMKQQTGVQIIAAPADPERAVRERKEDVVIIIEKDFSKNMARAIPAPLKLISDATRDTARPKVARVRALVNAYSSQLAGLRLIARGVAPSIAMPVRVQEVEVSSAQERLATLLNILPLLLVMAALTGGMQIAIDTTAGERERGSLEPLLLSPIPRVALAAGKWLAAVAGYGNPFSRVGWRVDEPARPGAATGVVLERRRDVHLDIRPFLQRGARLHWAARAAANAARIALISVPLVKPAVAGADTDCRPICASRGCPGRQAARRDLLCACGCVRTFMCARPGGDNLATSEEGSHHFWPVAVFLF